MQHIKEIKMNQPFEKWSEMTKKMQAPFQAIAELNVKTLQGLTYLKPDEIAHIKKPEELVEKQISLAVENGHKTLDYMQKSFEIIEKAMLSFVQEVKKSENKHI
jgi:hypothetical protein